MKKSLFLVFLGCLFMSAQVMAQMTVSGTVTDDGGEPLIGVNIVEKGTTNGTVTDLDGNYAIQVADGATLVFSYVGFQTRELLVTSPTMNLTLIESGLLDEVVVTALSVERNAREVVYANQTIGAEELISVPNKTALEALQGKLAGVKIQKGSGGVGASTRIVSRGESSLTGDNNVLIVIDGIPIDNASSGGGTSAAAENGYIDFGNRFNDLNPDDIESITMLKGPAATSLYGSRGASGVLVVTTKRGSKDGAMSIGLNHSTSFEKAYVLLQRQDKFGQGYTRPFVPVGAPPAFDTGENWSWGPAFDGVVRPWTSPVDADGDGDFEFLSRPYSAVENQLEDFFDMGVTTTNGLNLSGSKGAFTYYASYANTYQKGITPGTDYKRNSFNLNASAQLHEKIRTDFSVAYSRINQNAASEGGRAFEGTNAYANAIQAPVNIPYTELRDYTSPFHDLKGYYASYTVNPYFILATHENKAEINNLFGKMGVTVTPIEGLDITTRVGANVVGRTLTNIVPVYAYEDHYVWYDNLTLSELRSGRYHDDGSYSRTEGVNTNLDLSALASYSKDFGASGDYSIDVTAGYNFFQRQTQAIQGNTVGGLIIPEFYNLSNSAQPAQSTQASSKRRIYGVYANASFGWRNMIFVEYSARNDWSSTLPQDNNSFFYQAGGLSAILTEISGLQNNRWLNYLKIRGNVGTTGKDAGLYLLESTFLANPVLQALSGVYTLDFPLNGQAGITVDNSIGNPALKPELTLTYEVGADVTVFENRLNVEYTYYQSKHSDQIVQVNLPYTSGYSLTASNIGQITNKGHELTVGIRPIKGVKDFNWSINYIFAKNKSNVDKVSDDVDELVFTSWRGVSIVAKEGLPFGTFKALDWKRNDAGQLIVGANGLPIDAEEETYFGSYQPDFTSSIGTDIGYKGLTFNILFDIKVGGNFASVSKFYTEFNGTALTTLYNDRQDFVVDGVVDNGDGTFSENTAMTTVFDWIDATPPAGHIIDASYVKLREIGLSYTLPNKFLKDSPVKGLTVGFSAKNVKFWLPDDNVWADPEVSGPALTGNGIGIETAQTPPSRSYGFNVGLKF